MLGNDSGIGLVITLATHDGLYVNSAGYSGVVVSHAGGDGVYVSSTGAHGLDVGAAGFDGVHAASASASHFGGWFRNQIDGGGGVRAEGGSNEAPDLVLGGVGAEDDGRIYSEPSLSGSDILLYSNDVVQIDLDEDNNSTSLF